ncbi:hypothetical protein [Kitasatospora sp. NPDC057223]|uniref:hypothetical protein n=1 Tax=Kitasatospora sp. NPDC057223 TaxID=3346055 RepID=UPI00362EA587
MSDLAQNSSVEEARSRAERIRTGMALLAQWQTDVIAAYAARDWIALGYETWAAYLDGEYGEHRVRLPRDQRREIVAGMAQAGMSTRAIGDAVGSDQSTVVRDLSATDANASVERTTVLSLDGRERPAARTAPDLHTWVEQDDSTIPGQSHVLEHTALETVTPTVTRRRPLPEAFADAGRDLTRAAEKLTRLTEDDRFTRNRDATHHQVPELIGALEHTTRLVQAMNLSEAGASEEARRWWATSLHKISDALTGVANSLEQEQ